MRPRRSVDKAPHVFVPVQECELVSAGPRQCRRIHPAIRRDWARNLRHRTGWHSIKTIKQDVLLVFMIVKNMHTHYIKLGNLSSPTIPP